LRVINRRRWHRVEFNHLCHSPARPPKGVAAFTSSREHAPTLMMQSGMVQGQNKNDGQSLRLDPLYPTSRECGCLLKMIASCEMTLQVRDSPQLNNGQCRLIYSLCSRLFSFRVRLVARRHGWVDEEGKTTGAVHRPIPVAMRPALMPGVRRAVRSKIKRDLRRAVEAMRGQVPGCVFLGGHSLGIPSKLPVRGKKVVNLVRLVFQAKMHPGILHGD